MDGNNQKTDLTSSFSSVQLFLASTVILISAACLHWRIIKKKNRERWNKAGKDIAVLHCPTPGYFTPNVSPFVFKLITYLRLAKIPYKLDHDEPMSKKGKTPWITINGEDIADSQQVIEALAKLFNKNFSNYLTEEQRAIARAFTIMLDEHLVWGLRYWRYKVDNGRNLTEGMWFPYYMYLVKPFFLRAQNSALWHQGVGRHTPEEVVEITTKVLTALSDHLGAKPYLMGRNLCEVDCSMFAFVANILYNYKRSPYYSIVKDKCSNLGDYVQRVKDQLWPDWEECLDTRK